MMPNRTKKYLYIWCLVGLCSPLLALPVFKVQILVVSNKAQVLRRATRSQLKKEIEILNDRFVTRSGAKIIRFVLNDIVYPDQIQKSSCFGLLAAADFKDSDWQNMGRAVRRCQDQTILPWDTIYFMVFDNYSKKYGYEENDSIGGRMNGHPTVLIDWVRLNHRYQAPEEHEMGHAFGLPHVCDPGARSNTDTNIMSSYKDCEGSNGGNRSIGFHPEQVAIIHDRIRQYQKLFASFDKDKLIQNPDFEQRIRFWKSRIMMYNTRTKRSGNYSGLVRSNDALVQSFVVRRSGTYTFQVYIRSRCEGAAIELSSAGRVLARLDIPKRTSGFQRFGLRPVSLAKGSKGTLAFRCTSGWLAIDDITESRSQPNPPQTTDIDQPVPEPEITYPVETNSPSSDKRVIGFHGYCLDIEKSGTKTSAILRRCNRSKSQLWSYTSGQLRLRTRLCLTSAGRPFSSVSVTTCDGRMGQIWSYQNGSLKNKGLCLNAYKSGPIFRLVTIDCHNGRNQKFKLE